MSGNTSETTLGATVSESLARWIDERAADADVETEEFLARLLESYRLAASDEADRESADERVERLGERLHTLQAGYEEALNDVRDRVISVKLETDGKADAGHDHPELQTQTEQLAAEAESLAEEVDELHGRIEGGFGNYEEVLEYLTDTTAELEDRIDVLARVTVEVRDQSRALTRQMTTRAAAEELARTANRKGVRRGKCGDCGKEVDVALLSAPECPFCSVTFADVDAQEGLGKLFGSAELVVGDPPALEEPIGNADADGSVGSQTVAAAPGSEQEDADFVFEDGQENR